MDSRPIIRYPIIVEGKYDKIKLDSLFCARVIPCDGFGIFKKKELLSLLRQLCERTPLIVLTDSDGAGLVIRNYLNSSLPKERLIHLYTPCVQGKERRKDAPSKQGLLGVEGMEAQLLRELLAPYLEGANAVMHNELTKTDFYELGLSGKADSAARREALCARLSLPPLSANALLCALNLLYTKEEFFAFYEK